MNFFFSVDFKKVFMVFLACVAFIFFWREKSVTYNDSKIISQEPEQVLVSRDQSHPINLNSDAIAEPLAHYRIKARVLSKERYWFDGGASVSPVDLALGWGPMSDPKVLRQLSVSQGNRYFYVSWKRNLEFPESEIMPHAANVHIIPATAAVKDQVLALRPGQIVDLIGDLVEVSDKRGSQWRSSLTRTDQGPGACEILYLKNLIID